MAGTLQLRLSALDGLPSSLPSGTPLEVSVGSTTVAFDTDLGAELHMPWWQNDGNMDNIIDKKLPPLEVIVTGALAFGVSSQRQRTRTVELGRGTLDVSRVIEGHFSTATSARLPIDVSLRTRNCSSALSLLGTVAWVPALESPISGLTSVVLHIVAAADLVLNEESNGVFAVADPPQTRSCYVQATLEPLVANATNSASFGTTADTTTCIPPGQLYHWLASYQTSAAVAEAMSISHSKPNQVFDCGVGQIFVAQPLRRVTWHTAFTCVDVAWAGDLDAVNDSSNGDVNENREETTARRVEARQAVEATGKAWAGGLELRLVVMDANTHAQLAFAGCPLEALLTQKSKSTSVEGTKGTQGGCWLPLTRYPTRSDGLDCGEDDNDCLGSILVDAVRGGRLKDAHPKTDLPKTISSPGGPIDGFTKGADHQLNPKDLLIESKPWPSPNSVASDISSDVFDTKCSARSPKGPAEAHSNALCTVVEQTERKVNANLLSSSLIRSPNPEPYSLCGQLFTKFSSMPGGGYGGNGSSSSSSSRRSGSSDDSRTPEPWLSLQGLQRLCEVALPRIAHLDLPRWYFRARVADASITEEDEEEGGRGGGYGERTEERRREAEGKFSEGNALNTRLDSHSNGSPSSHVLDEWAKTVIRAAARRASRAAAIGAKTAPELSSTKDSVGVTVDVVRSDGVLVLSHPHEDPTGSVQSNGNNPSLMEGGNVSLVPLSTVRHQPRYAAEEGAVRSIEQLLTAARCISAQAHYSHHFNYCDAAFEKCASTATVSQFMSEDPPCTVAAIRITWPLFQAWWTYGIPAAASMEAQQDRTAHALAHVEKTFHVLGGGRCSSKSSPSPNSRSRLDLHHSSRSSSDFHSGLLGEVQSLLGEAKAMDRGSARRVLIDTCQSAGRDACRLAWQAAAEVPSPTEAVPLDPQSEAEFNNAVQPMQHTPASAMLLKPITELTSLSMLCNELSKTLGIATDSLAVALDRLEKNAAQALSAASAVAHESSSAFTNTVRATVDATALEQIDAVNPAGNSTVAREDDVTTAASEDAAPVIKPSRPRSARLRAGAAARAQADLIRDEACCADAASQLDSTVAALLAELLAAVANGTCSASAEQGRNTAKQRSPVDPRERLSLRRRERVQAAVAVEARRPCVLFGTYDGGTTHDKDDRIPRTADPAVETMRFLERSQEENGSNGDMLAQSEGALAAVAVLRAASQTCAALCQRSSRLKRGRLAAFRRLKESVELTGGAKDGESIAKERGSPFEEGESNDMGALLKRLEHAYPPPAVSGETIQASASSADIPNQYPSSSHGVHPANTSVGIVPGSSGVVPGPISSAATVKKSRVPAALWVILSDDRPLDKNADSEIGNGSSRYTQATSKLSAAAERRLEAVDAEYERGGNQGPLAGCLCKALGPSLANALRRGCEAVLNIGNNSHADSMSCGRNGDSDSSTTRGLIAVVNALFPASLPPGTASTACALEPWVAGMDALPELQLRPVDAFMLRSFVLAARADARASGNRHEVRSGQQGSSEERVTDITVTAPLNSGDINRERRYLAPRAALPAALLVVAFVLHGTAAPSGSDDDEEERSHVGGTSRWQRQRKRQHREKEQASYEGNGKSVPQAMLDALDKYWEAADEIPAPTGCRSEGMGACTGDATTLSEHRHEATPSSESLVQGEGVELRPKNSGESSASGEADSKLRETGIPEAGEEPSNDIADADDVASFNSEAMMSEVNPLEDSQEEKQQNCSSASEPGIDSSLPPQDTGVDDDEVLQRGPLPHIPEGNEANEDDGDSQVEVNSSGKFVASLTTEIPGSETNLEDK